MTAGDALVMFPEGGNYTDGRHARAVEKLEEIGRPMVWPQAQQMQHLLPPKPTGALAAIAAAPDAHIAFVGHVGLEELRTMKDLWRGIPMDAHIVSRLWYVTSGSSRPSQSESNGCTTTGSGWTSGSTGKGLLRQTSMALRLRLPPAREPM